MAVGSGLPLSRNLRIRPDHCWRYQSVRVQVHMWPPKPCRSAGVRLGSCYYYLDMRPVKINPALWHGLASAEVGAEDKEGRSVTWGHETQHVNLRMLLFDTDGNCSLKEKHTVQAQGLLSEEGHFHTYKSHQLPWLLSMLMTVTGNYNI